MSQANSHAGRHRACMGQPPACGRDRHELQRRFLQERLGGWVEIFLHALSNLAHPERLSGAGM